jgi:hypothetical protein
MHVRGALVLQHTDFAGGCGLSGWGGVGGQGRGGGGRASE